MLLSRLVCKKNVRTKTIRGKTFINIWITKVKLFWKKRGASVLTLQCNSYLSHVRSFFKISSNFQYISSVSRYSLPCQLFPDTPYYFSVHKSTSVVYQGIAFLVNCSQTPHTSSLYTKSTSVVYQGITFLVNCSQTPHPISLYTKSTSVVYQGITFLVNCSQTPHPISLYTKVHQ